ncbi:MAG: SMC-Scp complex subunit ScpB [Candidatus Zambryskibacteria bacterium]|nr:SMC-Scp complex subunit ScpB [Candidatus Zambryskibacteria bacterium]
MKDDLISKIEAILFYLAEPVEIDFLAKTLDISKEETLQALGELSQTLNSRGVRLVFHNDEVVITTAPEYSEVIEKIIKEERERDLGRAGIETLSIIAYRSPISKKEIEYIRGVNSQYALRNLLLRGLIERKNSETDMRVISYNITGDTLRYLGLSDISELPEYEEVRKKLEVVEENEEELDEEKEELE